MANLKYFFDQDQDSHWYMIPERMKANWETLVNKPYTDEDDILWEVFDQYKINGGITGILFTPDKSTL